jgi:F-type H+-transporting ATPase subunit b
MHAVFLLAAAEPSSTGLVLPKLDEFIWALIAFVILFAVLAKLAFPALRKGLEAREQAIRGELERAEQARLEGESKREEYDRLIADARSEADRIVREANESIEAVRRDRISKAEDEARQIIDKARTDANQERQRAFDDLRRTMADISIEAATRVLGKELSDPNAQRQLVEQFIAQAGNGSNN